MIFNFIFLYLLVGLSIFLESFPISSSGHIFLLQQFFEKIGFPFCLDENLEYCLHGPIAFVVAIFFYNRWKLLLDLPRSFLIIQKMFIFGFITDGITVAAYFLFFNHRSVFPLWIGFLITGLVLLSLFFCNTTDRFSSWNYKNSIILGSVQSLALLPGISRFGTTFVVGRWLGFSARKSFELSFLIEWPISFFATFKGTYTEIISLLYK
jgi:undecaprenyl-diphosphatase